jgi:hypothetical protein
MEAGGFLIVFLYFPFFAFSSMKHTFFLQPDGKFRHVFLVLSNSQLAPR